MEFKETRPRLAVVRFSWLLGPVSIAVLAGTTEGLVLLLMAGNPGEFADVFAVTVGAILLEAAAANVLRFLKGDFAILALGLFVVSVLIFSALVAFGAKHEEDPSAPLWIAGQYGLALALAVPSLGGGQYIRTMGGGR